MIYIRHAGAFCKGAKHLGEGGPLPPQIKTLVTPWIIHYSIAILNDCSPNFLSAKGLNK
jgi:hypothetical protein